VVFAANGETGESFIKRGFRGLQLRLCLGTPSFYHSHRDVFD
jgi:hypothetical protein